MAARFRSPSGPSGSLPARLRAAWQQWLHPARQRLQQHPFSRITSLDEIPIAVALGIRIDANQATVDDWLRLPGLSIHQARTLVTLSQRGVPFYCVEDLAAALGIPAHPLMPLRPLLQFCYYDAAAGACLRPLPLNQATLAQLLALPAMSAPLAKHIVRERQRSPYAHWADFAQRLQLSPEQIAAWMHYLRI